MALLGVGVTDLSAHTWKLRLWHFDNVLKFTWLEHKGQKDSMEAEMTPKCPHRKYQLIELKNTFIIPVLPHFPCPIHIFLAPYIHYSQYSEKGKKIMFQEKCFPLLFPFGSEIVACGALRGCSQQDADLARADKLSACAPFPNNAR